MRIPQSIKVAAGVGVATLILATGTQAAPASPAKVIKIAAMVPISGPGSYFGVQDKQGIELALDKINKTGVNGYKLKVDYEDSQCAPLPATNAIKRSLEEFKPDVVVGEECSDATLAIAAITNRAKIPLLNAGSVTMKLTNSGYKYVFRILPDAVQQANSLADNVVRYLHAKTAVELYEKTNSGIDTANMFEKAFAAKGGKVIGRIDFAKDLNDFTSIATRVASMGHVDILPTFALEGQQVKLTRALAQAGVTKGGGGSAIQAGTIWLPWGFDKKAGKAAVGYIRITQFDPNDPRPIVQQFDKAFRAKYGADATPTHINAHAYDAILLIAEAVRRGGTDPQSIRDKLASIHHFEGTTGVIDFGPNGQTQDLSVIHYVETTPELGWKTLNWH
jgi:branched-chain amino acid transport system substrate-binding protein